MTGNSSGEVDYRHAHRVYRQADDAAAHAAWTWIRLAEQATPRPVDRGNTARGPWQLLARYTESLHLPTDARGRVQWDDLSPRFDTVEQRLNAASVAHALTRALRERDDAAAAYDTAAFAWLCTPQGHATSAGAHPEIAAHANRVTRVRAVAAAGATQRHGAFRSTGQHAQIAGPPRPDNSTTPYLCLGAWARPAPPDWAPDAAGRCWEVRWLATTRTGRDHITTLIVRNDDKTIAMLTRNHTHDRLTRNDSDTAWSITAARDTAAALTGDPPPAVSLAAAADEWIALLRVAAAHGWCDAKARPPQHVHAWQPGWRDWQPSVRLVEWLGATRTENGWLAGHGRQQVAVAVIELSGDDTVVRAVDLRAERTVRSTRVPPAVGEVEARRWACLFAAHLIDT